jgi:hypothetical protein
MRPLILSTVFIAGIAAVLFYFFNKQTHSTSPLDQIVEKISDFDCPESDGTLFRDGRTSACYALNPSTRGLIAGVEKNAPFVKWQIRSQFDSKTELWNVNVKSIQMLPSYECLIPVSSRVDVKVDFVAGHDFCRYNK